MNESVQRVHERAANERIRFSEVQAATGLLDVSASRLILLINTGNSGALSGFRGFALRGLLCGNWHAGLQTSLRRLELKIDCSKAGMRVRIPSIIDLAIEEDFPQAELCEVQP